MRKLLTFLIAGLLIGSSSLWAQTTSITISALSQWTSTGVTIMPEAAVTIEASGEWCGVSWSCYGPEGTGGIAPSAFLAPGLSSGGLVGKVGNNAPFLVGSTCSFNAQDHGTGILYLAFNDDLSGYGDNSGTLDVTITTTEEGGQTDLTAPFSATPPTIDGVIGGAEWQNANTYDLPFLDQNGNPLIVPVFIQTDGTFLYVAAEVPFPTHNEAFFGVYIDGDHSHTINGVATEPHIDIGYNKAGSDSPRYSFYDAYSASPGMFLTAPVGSEHAFSGTSELQYEFKIVLSDFGPTYNGTVGLFPVFGTNGTSSGSYQYPAYDIDVASYADLLIETGSGPPPGGILVYATSEITYGYYASSFDEQLPAILAEDGFTATVKDRIGTPEITAALLNGYDQLWIMSTDPYSGSGCFSSAEVSAILDFRNAGKGLLIMAGDGPPVHSYIGDANQVSTLLGVTFSGEYNYGPYAEPFEPDFSPHPLFNGVQTIVCTNIASILNVSSPSEVVATYQGNNMIAVLDDGKGRVVFDVSFIRFFDADERVGYVPYITVGNTPQYVKNIATWLSEGGQPPPPPTGRIDVFVQSYDDPCINDNPSLPGATVRIFSLDAPYEDQLETNLDGEADFPFLPHGHYTVEVTAPGHMTASETTQLTEGDSHDYLVFQLRHETASLVETNPQNGEIIDDTKTTITLFFNKVMDEGSINDPSLLSVTVNEIPWEPNEDYFIRQSESCPEIYRIYGDPIAETEMEFGYDKLVEVSVSSELLDEDGHQLGQPYSFSFETKSEFLSGSQETLAGDLAGGHYLEYDNQVWEETEYKIGIKGDLYPEPEQTITYSVEISSHGSWSNTLQLGPGQPYWLEIIEGERRFFTGLNGNLRIRMYDNSAAVLLKQIKYKFHAQHPFTKEELIIEMAPQQIDKPTCLDYLWMADVNYQAQLTDICTAIPVLGSIYRLLNAAGAALYDDRYECGFYDVPEIEVWDFLETDPSVYDYYSVPLSFDNIANDINTSTGFRVYKAVVEIPIRFDRSTPLDLGLVFKPWVSTFSYYGGKSTADPPTLTQLQNRYASPQPSNDFVTPNGQYWYGYQCDVNTGRSPNLPPDDIAHDPTLPLTILDDGLYTGFREEKDAICVLEDIPTLGRPVQLVLRGPENVTIDAVTHYTLTIKPEDKYFYWDKHAGYLFLQFDDNLISLGAQDENQSYGSLSDIEVKAYLKGYFPDYYEESGSGGFPVLGTEPLGNLPMLKSFLFDKLFLKLPSEVSNSLTALGLFSLIWDITSFDWARKGFDYAAPVLFPDPMPSKTENDMDFYRIGLFVDEFDPMPINSKMICSLVVDIPLIFHDLSAHFDIKYYGRPWKQRDGCKLYSLQDVLPVECGEHHYFIWYHITPSETEPPLIVKAFSPISLRLTDPAGNIVSRDQNSVPGATYTEYDTDLDGTNESEIVITQPLDGQYQIEAIPNPDADPLDEYSISVTWAGQGTVLADQVRIQDIPATPYVFNISLQPRVFGTVSEVGGSGLAGVTADVLDSTGSLVASIPTNTDGSYECTSLSPGLYTVSVVPPLGYEPTYNNVETRLLVGSEKEFNFYLQSKELANDARGVGYWKHQVNVYLSGKGNAQESLEQMSGYMNAIATHFNGNLANPVNIFEVPQPATQNDSLEALRDLLTAGHKSTMNEKARRHLTALLLNVASLKLHQTTIISEDSATASQAITYCYQLITDGNPDNNETAKDIADMINEGQIVPAGMIDPSTVNIAYKQNDTEQLPTEYSLSQNYPNPFNPVTEINFALPSASDVTLEIFNIMGQRVTVLAEGPLEAGYHSVTWDGSHVASGVYFYRLDAGDFVESRKMVLLK